MNWEQALRQRLLDDAAVAVLAGARVFWRVRKQGTPLPAVVLTIVSDPRPQTLKGFAARRESRVQIDCWSSGAADVSRAALAALREAVIAALAPGGDFYGVRFGRANFDPVRDLGELTEAGFNHRDQFDLLVFHD